MTQASMIKIGILPVILIKKPNMTEASASKNSKDNENSANNIDTIDTGNKTLESSH